MDSEIEIKIIKLIKQMLKRNPEERPSIFEVHKCVSDWFTDTEPLKIDNIPEYYENSVNETLTSNTLQYEGEAVFEEESFEENEHLFSKKEVEKMINDLQKKSDQKYEDLKFQLNNRLASIEKSLYEHNEHVCKIETSHRNFKLKNTENTEKAIEDKTNKEEGQQSTEKTDNEKGKFLLHAFSLVLLNLNFRNKIPV